MTKNELIEAIASEAGTTKVAASKMIAAFVGVITGELVAGGQLILPGFVTIKSVERPARTGRDPRSGKEIKISARRVAVFKAGKQLKESLQKE